MTTLQDGTNNKWCVLCLERLVHLQGEYVTLLPTTIHNKHDKHAFFLITLGLMYYWIYHVSYQKLAVSSFDFTTTTMYVLKLRGIYWHIAEMQSTK